MAVAFVRNTGIGEDGETTHVAAAQSVVLTVPAAGHALGNTLVVWMVVRGAAGVTTITDTGGNTYVKQREVSRGDKYYSIWTAYLATGLTSGQSVTIANSSTSAIVAAAAEFSGVSQTAPVDTSAGNSGMSLTATVTCPITSGADRMLVAGFGYGNDSHPTTSTPSGWTALSAGEWVYSGGIGQEVGLLTVYRAVPTAASVNAGWLMTSLNTPEWAAGVVALQSAPAGGTPVAPTLLNATTVSASAIDLTWTDNASDEVTFRIERGLDGVTFAEIGSNAANDVTYSDTGLTAGTTYFYRVRARNASGDSAYTNIDSATTTPSSTVTVPNAPVNLAATSIGSTRIQLDWTDASTDEDGFKIERSVDASTWVQVAVVGANVTSWVNSGLQPSTLYYYRVRSYNSAGNSGYTPPASAVTFDEGTEGDGDCPVERYATVEDVQRLIWSSHLAISDTSEPNRASVEDWLCDITQWIDRTLAWKYAVPVTDEGDREVLRPICASLVAARCWQALVARFPGQEERSVELESEGLSRLVYNPGGIGTRLKGGSSVVVTHRSGNLGRSLLVLTGTAETSAERAGVRYPSHTFTDPEDEDGVPRRFGLTKEM